ncbi:MAG: ribosome silencing factor [Oscillospiraceae bacterium]|nr:ribosome silencing factor [Candidatus Equicaccousia limihippi]
MTVTEKTATAIKALDDKKGIDISAYKTDSITSLCDYMIFASATSNTHARALCDTVEEKLSQQGVMPHHIEGRATGWYLLDYTDFIVHIFTPDLKEFYGLEKLWSDGEPVDISEFLE